MFSLVYKTSHKEEGMRPTGVHIHTGPGRGGGRLRKTKVKSNLLHSTILYNYMDKRSVLI